MTETLPPLSAGDSVGAITVGGLIEATDLVLRYATADGQLLEFAPQMAFERGDEGIMLPRDPSRAAHVRQAAQAWAEAAGLGAPIEANNTLYLHARLPHGRSLKDALADVRVRSPEDVRSLLSAVCRQLKDASAPHGSLGLSHIFVPDTGAPYVTGFGEAQARSLLGQPATGLPGEAGDVYALSECAYTIVTGQPPAPYAQRQAALEAGGKDPLVAASEYADTAKYGSLIRAIGRGLSLTGDPTTKTLEDWAFTVEGRSRLMNEGTIEAPKAEPVAPSAPRRPMRPVRPVRSQPAQQPVQGSNLGKVALFLAGLALITGAAVYASQSGLFERRAKEPEVAVETPAGPSASEERAWVNARTIDTVGSYSAYLERYPEGAFAAEAQGRLDALDDAAWQAAVAGNTLDDFQAYIDAFPLGLHVPEAQQLIDRIKAGQAAIAAADVKMWEEARRSDTVSAYDGYLSAYPDGQYVDEARKRREAVLEVARDNEAFEAASRLGTKAAYQSYVNRFSKGRHVSKALAMLDKLTTRAGDVITDCRQCPPVVVIGAGSFEMGAAPGDGLAKPSEKPRRTVTITKPFAIGQTEVTVGQWKSCLSAGACRAAPEQGSNDLAPVVYVSWDDATAYAAWLARTTGKPYRLPTEAEWEYAARAGDEGVFAAGREGSVCQLGNIAGSETGLPQRTRTCSDGAAGGVEAARQRLPNAFGLYDMIGNAAEWVQDCDGLDYRDAPTDGRANERGLCGSRIARGGSWISGPRDFRLSSRTSRVKGDRDDFTGFRVALTLPD